MALKKPTPTFEQEPTTATATAEAPAAAAAAPAAQAPQPAAAAPSRPAAAVEATTAIAKAAATAVATTDAQAAAKNFRKEVEAMRGGADFSYGAHRVFKAKDGVIRETAGEKLVLGKWVKVRMLAWDNHFEISPGEEGKSAGDYVAYSNDGNVIDQVIGEELKSWIGRPVNEYVEYLKTEEDFEKAGKREFIDVEVAAMGSEEEPDFNEIVQITLSSSSIPAFRSYQTKLEATAKAVSMNLPGYTLPEDPFTFYFIREAAEKGKNTWTKLRIANTLPAKV